MAFGGQTKFPTPAGGDTPPEPAITLSDDDTLVTSLAVTDAQEVDENTLAPGWSY